MPALQVRDFPPSLYDELKEYAARNHRSIAQQTIIAVEEMLAAASASGCAEVRMDGSSPSYAQGAVVSQAASEGAVCFGRRESPEAREARKRRRQQLFKMFDEIPWKGSRRTTDEIAALVREGRDEASDRAWRTLDPWAADDLLSEERL